MRFSPLPCCVLGRRIRTWVDYYSETDLDQTSSLRLKWETREKLVRQFKHLWLRQYLPQLQERQKWKTRQPNIRVGDLVLLETDHVLKHRWPVARVKEIITGKDGQIRSVTVKTADGKTPLKRSVHQLFPLEGQADRLCNEQC